MCPHLSSDKIQSLCNCFSEGLMCPSIQERQYYCFSEFKNCPYYQIKIDISIESIEDVFGLAQEGIVKIQTAEDSKGYKYEKESCI